jgi:hypothetical protein
MKLLEKGRTLVCEIADFDACDKYFFHVDGVAPSLTVAWKLKGCGDNGVLKTTAKALDAGTKLIAFGQGNVSRWKGAVATSTEECEDGCDCHTPPFLLSRGVYKRLKSGEPVELNVFGELATFTKKKKALSKRPLIVDGEKTTIQTLHATGSDGDLWFVDDAACPLIVRVEAAGGDNYCELAIVTSKSIDATESDLAEDE